MLDPHYCDVCYRPKERGHHGCDCSEDDEARIKRLERELEELRLAHNELRSLYDEQLAECLKHPGCPVVVRLDDLDEDY